MTDATPGQDGAMAGQDDVLVRVENLVKYFPVRTG